MEAQLINIGTSKGVRIPAAVLKSFDTIPESFDIVVNEHQIILNIKENPREGWGQKFKNYDDQLLIDDSLDLEEFDEL